MMKQILFTGCATALITPFTQEGVDEKALRTLVDYQIENGVSALIACGTTGEPSTMSDQEWALTLRTVIEQARGRVPVIAGTGGNDTRRVIRCAEEARALGADGQLCVTPYYNKTTQQGLIAHYTAIAEKSALPVIIYNVPSRTGLSIRPETLAALKAQPRIVAVKEATADMVLAGEMMRLCGEELAFYSGSDEVTVPLMSLGGLGVISVLSNIAPRETVAMTKAMLEGDCKTAAQWQLRLLPLIRALFSEVNPIPVKAALHAMGLCENRLRLPLIPLSDANAQRLKDEMRKLGLIA